MRTLAIGDIHGCLTALERLLDEVRPEADDVVITLGDYVDRGPDSRGVVDRLLVLARSCQLIPLRGNHDVMMCDARNDFRVRADWLQVGGRAALASYAPPDRAGLLDDVPAEHWHFLDNVLLDWHQNATHFFVHGNVLPDIPLAEQPAYVLHWEKLLSSQPPHVSGKIMVCGHTAQRTGKPLNLGHALCIDTWAYGQGWLTCLDADSGAIWQTNQRGEFRTARLENAET